MASLTGRSLHPGAASGRLLVLDEPLSFWGGSDLSGTIADRRHPQRGQSLVGRVLAMRSGRGSSSSSSVLAEQLRRGTGPAAIVLTEPDPIILLGALVADELYGFSMPVVILPQDEFARLRTDDLVEVSA